MNPRPPYTVEESGFERVPAHRRERAFRMNAGGWAAQMEHVRQYVEGQASDRAER